jgi:hypothetical protein
MTRTCGMRVKYKRSSDGIRHAALEPSQYLSTWNIMPTKRWWQRMQDRWRFSKRPRTIVTSKHYAQAHPRERVRHAALLLTMFYCTAHDPWETLTWCYESRERGGRSYKWIRQTHNEWTLTCKAAACDVSHVSRSIFSFWPWLLLLNVSKTSVLPKDTTQQVFFDVVHNIINVNPRIDVQNFIAKTCRTIIDDVEKLDAIQDDFIH